MGRDVYCAPQTFRRLSLEPLAPMWFRLRLKRPSPIVAFLTTV